MVLYISPAFDPYRVTGTLQEHGRQRRNTNTTLEQWCNKGGFLVVVQVCPKAVVCVCVCSVWVVRGSQNLHVVRVSHCLTLAPSSPPPTKIAFGKVTAKII
jgi:hypothetical protein